MYQHLRQELTELFGRLIVTFLLVVTGLSKEVCLDFLKSFLLSIVSVCSLP